MRTPGRIRIEEPGTEHPRVRVWRDWVLAAGVAGTAVAETVVHGDLLWRPVALPLGHCSP